MKTLLAWFTVGALACAAPLFNGSQAFVDPRGFIVKVPTGWHATPLGADQGLRGVAVGAPDGSTASVVFGERDNTTPVTKVLGTVVDQTVLHGAQLVKSKVEHGDGYLELREYTYESHGPCRLRMLFYARGGGYTAWFLAGGQQNFSHDTTALVDVLNSFHFVHGDPSASIEMHTAQPDGAFQVGFPAGWTVDARTVRTGIGLYHTISANAPQHTASVHTWTPYPLQFTTPTAVNLAVGRGPGARWVDHGVQYILEPYMSPKQCLEFLARATPELQGLEIGEARQVPIKSAGWSRDEADYIELSYPVKGATGGALVRTYSIEGPQAGLWWAEVSLWLGKAGHEEEGRQALATCLKTVRMNQQWVAQQNEAVAQQSRMLQSEHAALDGIFQHNVDVQNAAREGVARRGDDIVQGRDSYADTDGNIHHIQIDATSNYYWKGAGGTVYGTATAQPPGPDVTQLLRVP